MAEVKSATVELARKAVAAVDAGDLKVGLIVIATIDGQAQMSADGYTPEMAQHLAARFSHWQLDQMAKADLMAAASRENVVEMKPKAS